MLVVRGRLERRQAIVRIGLQRFVPDFGGVQAEQPALALPIIEYRALLDTGAQRTCLTHSTIAAEGLKRHGNRLIRNVHSEALHSLYFATVGFWSNGTAEAMHESRGYYGLPEPTEVINIADNDNFDAIIGMDVLRFFDVSFERTGHFEVRLV